MRRTIPIFLLLLAAVACGGSNDAQQSRQPMTERERDSAIAESPLPGARGVKGAMSAADSAAARNARLDSIANEMQ